MKPRLEVCTPHRDIRAGKLDEAVFAADLSDVVADRGPLEYRDAQLFFRETYPTQGLQRLLESVLLRLSGKGAGGAVIQIQTPFGGGKTHSLIALYHFFQHPQEAANSELGEAILRSAGVERVPETRVVTFVGTAADPLKGRTPWGELAGQLGRYDLLAEHDQRRLAPGKDLLHQLLGEAPTLILMDELVEYAVKARDFQAQVLAFFQELTEAVKVQPRCALVVTLPSSAPYGEEGERVLHQLQLIFGRMEAIYTPVEGEEIYEVIRRRLFEAIHDPTEAQRTADAYWEMYQHLGNDLPQEVRDPAYRERLRRAYPFHPELIDILFERWSTFPTFQRTRGVLRLLAEVVADRYRKNDTAPLILPSHIDLSNPAIRREFLKHIGNEFDGVIASDIAGPNAKAPQIDRELGSEYARFGVVSALATAIFFGSFSGGQRRGVGIQRLRLMTLRDGLPPAIISDALRRLEETLWYLHEERGTYEFRSQPNLNRILVEKEEAVSQEQITAEMWARLQRLAGTEMRVILWPRTSQDVPDTRELKLAVLSPEHTRQAVGTEPLARELLERCGQPFRIYRNTLLLLVADEGELTSARQQIKRYLAYRTIQDDKALMRQLTEENRKALEGKMKDAENTIGHQLLSAYRYLAKAEEGGVRWYDLGLPTVGTKPSLADRVREYLHGEDMLLSKIAPRLIEKNLPPEEGEKSLSEIHEAFLRYPNLPMLESKQVLLEAVAKGVQEGVFGVRIGEQIFHKGPLSPGQIGDDAVLVREPAELSDVGGEVKGTETDVVVQELQRPGHPPGTTGYPSGGEKTVESYTLRATIPWDRLSDFVRGVVMPLRQDGAELKVEVCLEAQSAAGIKPTTLETVKETLSQIGARVIDVSPAIPGREERG
ncbi:MAG: DUF499 domain-containing protein [Candidatus Caldarchaeum sp.]